tara:strand:- start:469 stop:783 length:315 start_codon:yes stop_codon:yes gene_type:complete
MAVTIDSRPTYFGDRMVVTGSYAATDTSIDLSGLLISIDGVILNSALAQVKHQDVDIANGTSYAAVSQGHHDNFTFSGATITVFPPLAGMDTAGGTFVVIGRRS